MTNSLKVLLAIISTLLAYEVVAAATNWFPTISEQVWFWADTQTAAMLWTTLVVWSIFWVVLGWHFFRNLWR